MKTFLTKTIFSLCLFTGILSAASSEYQKVEFEKAQSNGEKILLHFHADWCPTCKKQEKVLKELDSSGDLKSIKLLVANYDSEKDLKKTLNVNSQSTLVAFIGTKEVGRSSGVTDAKKLKEFVQEKFK